MSDSFDSQVTSVIMDVSTAGSALDASVESVLMQTSPVEILFVCDGDCRDAVKSLEERVQQDSRLKIVTGHGAFGAGAAKNAGARAAKGSHLLFLQSGALLPPTAVARFCSVSQKARRPFLLGAKITDQNGVERSTSRQALLSPLVGFVEALRLAPFFPKACLSLTHHAVPTKIAAVPAVSGACLFMPAQDFWMIKGFGERYEEGVETVDFCLRFHRAEGNIYFVPDVAIATEEANDFDPDSGRKRAKSLALYFYENYSHVYPQPVLWLLDLVLWAPFLPALALNYVNKLTKK